MPSFTRTTVSRYRCLLETWLCHWCRLLILFLLSLTFTTCCCCLLVARTSFNRFFILYFIILTRSVLLLCNIFFFDFNGLIFICSSFFLTLFISLSLMLFFIYLFCSSSVKFSFNIIHSCFDIKVVLHTIERLFDNFILEHYHWIENFVKCRLAVKVNDVDMRGSLTDPMTSIFSLEHHGRCPMHLCKDDRACSCKCQSEAGCSDWKNCHATLFVGLELLDVCVTPVAACLSIDTNETCAWMLLLHMFLNRIDHCLMMREEYELFLCC